jgi:inorganic pyrophosphatase
MAVSETGIIIFLACCILVGFLVTFIYLKMVVDYDREAAAKPVAVGEDSDLKHEINEEMLRVNADGVYDLVDIISAQAHTFLYEEYKMMAVFIVIFGGLIFYFTGAKGKVSFTVTDNTGTHYSEDWAFGAFSAFSFVVGAVTSIIAGYIGMYIATIANGRVTMKCYKEGIGAGFSMAIQGGMVMGFGLCTLGLCNLLVMWGMFRLYFKSCDYFNNCELNSLYDALAAYGLGASSIAMFGRVGGGIYTKAADVGADLVGKVSNGLEEDDVRNPATIADNVGDNVGDIAGMGSDLFGSFAEGTCAAMVVLASANNCVYWDDEKDGMFAMASNVPAMMFPISITAVGLVACFITSLFATVCSGVKLPSDVEKALKLQLVISTVLMTPLVVMLAYWLLPSTFYVAGAIGVYDSDPQAHKAVCQAGVWNPVSGRVGQPAGPIRFGSYPNTAGTVQTQAFMDGTQCMGAAGITAQLVHWYDPAICVIGGLWAGLVIGFVTEYYTSNTYQPVKDVAQSCQTGAATNIIYGLALGYNSVVVPVLALAMSIYAGFALAQMFGVACAALGMLGTMAICLTIDGYGPIADNAGGIAEMVEGVPHEVRELTDALDAAGNTTAAIGKGFAIGSAAMVALALFGGYCTRADIKIKDVSILEPMTFFGLLVGSMLPYWFSAMTMKSVGLAAMEMVETCKKQFESEYGKKVLAGEVTPTEEWYAECIAVATQSSLKEMVAPSALVMFSPLIMGIFFGKFALSGLLVGGIVSGIQMALSASNTGGAWDNAKKYIEAGKYEEEGGTDEVFLKAMQKGTEAHTAAVIGDTVGDPLKDTSGPAINILMKLMAIIALVFAPFVAATRDGYGLIGCSLNKNCHA